jgi:hypothetical protein
MSVKLRVKPTRGVLAEHPHHQPFSVYVDDVAVLTKTRMCMPFDPGQHCFHRPVVGLDDLFADPVVTHREQH